MTAQPSDHPAPPYPVTVPPHPISLVASDIDGTLLHNWEPIPDATVRAIRACLDAGIIFMPVTGRPVRWLDPVHRSVPELGPVICANGSIVYDLRTAEVLAAHTIAQPVLAAFVEQVRAEMPEAVLGFETLSGLSLEHGFHTRFPQEAQFIEPDASPEVDGVVKILLRTGSRDSDAMVAQVRSILHADSLHPTHSSPNNGLVELSASGVTKARTLESFCQAQGIPVEAVAAFGDMPNDIEMLSWAGTGYAMANGHALAIAAADAVVPAVADGGVAEALLAIASAFRASS